MTLTDTVSELTKITDRSRERSALTRRLAATGRAALTLVTAWFAIPLLVFFAVFAALTPLTIVAPLLVPITWLVRRYADAARRNAHTVLGTTVAPPYRTLERPGVISRVLTILRDPASWRDALWLFVHLVVAVTLSLTSIVLLLGTVFYLIFPFLFAVTPPAAFGTAFGFVTIHTVAQAFLFVPVALVTFGLWWWLAEPLRRGIATADLRLLAPRAAAPVRRFAA